MVTRLPWQPQCYVNNSFVLNHIDFTFGMVLLYNNASVMYLVLMVTRLPWQPQCYVNNSFVLSLIEVIFGMKLS